MWKWIACLLLLLLPAAPSLAIPITWTWTVRADSVLDPADLTGLSDGGTFLVELEVDTDASPLSVAPDAAVYLANRFSMVFPSTTATSTGPGAALLVIDGNKHLLFGGSPGDALGATTLAPTPLQLTGGATGSVPSELGVFLADDTGGLLPNSSLPTTAPALAGLATGPTSLLGFAATVNGVSRSVTLDDLTVLSVAVAVPEPATGALVAAGLVALAAGAMRHRRTA